MRVQVFCGDSYGGVHVCVCVRVQLASFPGFLFSFFNCIYYIVCRVVLSQNSFIARVQIFFVASVYYAIMEFICDNEKENWEPGDEARCNSACEYRKTECFWNYY